MSVRNWVGIVLAVVLFVIFGLYVHGHDITAVAGFTFGGGLLFCGVLIDFDHFLAVVKAWKGDK